MDSKGHVWENISIERLRLLSVVEIWRSVKQEYVSHNFCDDGQKLWRGLADYFRFYNTERPHQNLD